MVTKVIGNDVNKIASCQYFFSQDDFDPLATTRYIGNMPDGLYRAISSNNKDKYAYLVVTTAPSGVRNVIGINHAGTLVPLHRRANATWFHGWDLYNADVEIRIVPRA